MQQELATKEFNRLDLLTKVKDIKEAFETYGLVKTEVEGALDMLESDIVYTRDLISKMQ